MRSVAELTKEHKQTPGWSFAGFAVLTPSSLSRSHGLGTGSEVIEHEQTYRRRQIALLAILVDLGGAETNSEMAVEMLPPDRRETVVVCNAPIVEGAVMAATEAAGGSPLEKVRAVAEELSAS